MATRRDRDPNAEPIPIPEPESTAWIAPQHRLLDVHTLLTLLYVALAIAVWNAKDARFVDARMPVLMFGIGVVGPYWWGKESKK